VSVLPGMPCAGAGCDEQPILAVNLQAIARCPAGGDHYHTASRAKMVYLCEGHIESFGELLAQIVKAVEAADGRAISALRVEEACRRATPPPEAGARAN
jgi:hypothetical protein